jgi:predicted Rossmann fold nucleotide-binding protein DprA/Smf involved in DNA uptake
MTRLHDTIRALLKERQDCVTRVSEIDQELASVQAMTSEAIASVTPIAPARTAVPATTRPADIDRTHHRAQRAAALGIKFEREICTALVAAPTSSKHVAKMIGRDMESVKRSLTELLKAGRVVKIGQRGPSVRWTLPGGVGRAPRRAADETVEFETVFPKPGAPKASPREAVEAARAQA